MGKENEHCILEEVVKVGSCHVMEWLFGMLKQDMTNNGVNDDVREALDKVEAYCKDTVSGELGWMAKDVTTKLLSCACDES